MLADSEVRMKSIERDVLQLRESNRELEISSQRNDDTLKVVLSCTCIFMHEQHNCIPM